MENVSRTRGYYRMVRRKAINRKLSIRINQWGREDALDYYNDKKRGGLSKGKVHCSCGLCVVKSHLWTKHSDRKNKLRYSLKNWYLD